MASCGYSLTGPYELHVGPQSQSGLLTADKMMNPRPRHGRTSPPAIFSVASHGTALPERT